MTPDTGPPFPSIGTRRLVVIGGSVIGLACAWSAARTRLVAEVVIHEPDDSGPDGVPSSAAAWVAGGMLAPFSEAWPGEEAVFALGVDSLRRWPEMLSA
ncbi:FAD-dependent oxidoreductase, partial [Dietzia sp. SYD-A1]|uniref:FAD-dependent oxidoreductase n=1 Tax=Dietzia sp. SYD-A1 TaxID=2780141 RepID=UPI00189169C7